MARGKIGANTSTSSDPNSLSTGDQYAVAQHAQGPVPQFVNFAAGNIVVYRVGDGSAALAGTATAVFLDEYTSAGVFVRSIALPTADNGANQTLTATGNSTSEGFLALSNDGHYLIVPGYDVAPGGTTTTASNFRVIGVIGADGIVDTTRYLTDLGSGNFRGVASEDGTSFYVSTSGAGVHYATSAATLSTHISVQIESTPSNIRTVGLFGGQLYDSSMSTTFRISTVGSGEPTTTGQTVTNLTGVSTNANSSPYAFFFADLTATVAGVDTLYVADDASTPNGGGIQKYSLVSGSWILNGTILDSGVRGLTASVSSGVVTLFATTSSSLDKLVDSSGYNGTLSGSLVHLVTAATNTAFRGISLAPTSAGDLSINDASAAEGNVGTTNITFTVTRAGSSTGAIGATWTLTLSGTANSADFSPASQSGTVSFATGETSKQITVTVQGDVVYEGNETFTVVLSNPTGGATIADAIGDGTILNDDAPVPPAVDLNGGDPGINFSGGYFEQGGGALLGNGIVVTQGTLPIASATIDITDAIAGDSLNVGALPAGITVDPSSTATHFVLVGAGTDADWATALSSVSYLSFSDNPDVYATDTARTISVTLSDGVAPGTAAIATIAITADNDAPVLGNLNGDFASFVQGDSYVLLDAAPLASVTDVDNQNFAGGFLQVGVQVSPLAEDEFFVQAGGSVSLTGTDVYVGGTMIGGISQSGPGQILRIDLNASATAGLVATLLDAIAYRNTAGNSATGGNRSVSWLLNDGHGDAGVAVSTVQVIVTRVDLNGAGAGLDFSGSYTEQGTGALIGSGITVTSTLPVTRATVDLADARAGDTLNLGALPGGITLDPSSTGTHFVLVGTGTSAAWAAALSSVSYLSFSDDPDAGGTDAARTLNITVSDGTHVSATAVATIAITAVNDAPTTGAASVNGTEDTTYVFQLSDFPFSDPDSSIAGIQIETLPANGSLRYNGNPVSLFFGPVDVSAADIASGLLTFVPAANGNGAAYAAFDFQVSDGQDYSGTATMTVNIAAVIDPPTIDLDANDNHAAGTGYAFTYDENAFGYQSVDSDVHVTAEAQITTVTVTLTDHQFGDQLFLNGQPSNDNILFSAYDTSTGVITISANGASAADIEDALRCIYFRNIFDDPDAGGTHLTRSITFTVHTANFDSNTATSTVTIQAVDDAPVVDLNGPGAGTGSSLTYTENGAFTAIAPAATVSDVDSANFLGGALTVTFAAGGTAGDRLTVLGGNGITFSANVIRYNGIDIATWANAAIHDGLSPLVITLEAGSTPTAVEALMRAIAYSNVSDDPGTTQRQLSVTISDGDGGTSTAAIATVDVLAVDDAPSGADKTITFTEDTTYTFATGDFGYSDALDNDAFLAVRIGSLPLFGTLRLNGNAVSTGDFIAVSEINAGHFTFTPAPNGAGNGYAVFNFQVQDDGGTDNGGLDLDQSPNTIVFNVTNVNDASVIDLNGAGGGDDASLAYTENGAATAVAPAAILTDVDANLNGETLTISFTGGGTADDRLTILAGTGGPTGGITFSGNVIRWNGIDIATWANTTTYDGLTPLVLHLEAGSTPPAVQALLRAIAYSNVSDDPSTAQRELSFVISGNSQTSNTAHVLIDVTATNDPATITGTNSGDVTEDSQTSTAGLLAVSDPDTGENQLQPILAGTPGASHYGTFEVLADGHWTYNLNNGLAAVQALNAGDTLSDSILVTSQDGTDTETIMVTIHGTDELSGNQAPLITSGPADAAGSAAEAPGLDGIPGADQTANNRLEPVVNYDATIVSLLAAHPNDMHALLTDLQAQLPSGSGVAEAIAIVWDYVDDHFSYYNTVINEISARLSVEYALYLQNGGAPLTGTAAKYTPDGADPGTAPDRYQSLHDNILGNLNGAGLVDKFLDSSGGGSNGPPNGTADQAAYDRIIQLLADNGLSDLFNRPVYSGTEGAPNLALGYDQAHGLLPLTGGTLTATDADGDTLTWSGSATGTYGTFTIDAATGMWSYRLDQFDPDTQALGAGESALDTFTATVSDGHGGSATQLVTITVAGANDAPTGTATALLAPGSEDVVYHVTEAQLLAGFSDIDGDTLSVTNLAADHGSVAAEPGGYAITLTSNYNGPVILTYQVDDGNGGSTSATQSFAVNGAPDVSGPVLGDATEGGGVYTFDPLANASDPDAGDGLVAIPVGPLPAGVSFAGATGTTIDFSDYTLGSVVGQHGWTDASPSSPDNQIVDVGGNRMLRLANDPSSGDFGGPYSPAFSLAAGEGAAAADTMSFSFTVRAVNSIADGSRLEIDLGTSARDDRYNFMVLEYTSGGIRLAQNTPTTTPDEWQSDNFDWGGNVQLGALLDASVSHTIQVVFRAVDGSNNDIVEFYVDGNLVGTGSTFENFREFHLAQPHASAIGTVDNVLFRAGEPAGVPFNADGPGGNRQGFYIDDLNLSAYDSHRLQFDANDPAYDHLAAGATQLVTVNYNVADGHGGVTPASTQILVHGTNDAASIGGTDAGAALEAGVDANNAPAPGTPSATGLLTISDVDDGENHLVAIPAGTAGTGGYGTFEVDANGAWTYTLNNADPDTNALYLGQVVTDTILVHSADGTASHTITVTITGANDAPVVTGPVLGDATEGGGVYTFDPLANASDPDAGDGLVAIPAGPLPAGVSFAGATGTTIDFSDYTLGSVVGQHGWTDASPSSPDNAIVDVGGNRMLRLANDPSSGDFGGPYSPAFSLQAGEGGAAADTMSFSFTVRAVNSIADGSRLEIDLGTSARDDRYNFMVLEYTSGGIRLAQNTPTTTPDEWQSDNFDWGGNVQLGALLDASVSHTIQVVFRAVDGSNNDIVEFYVDGNLVGTGSTFENFREFHLAQPHASAIGTVDNVLFRAGEPAGVPFNADGPGGNRQGFYIDDLNLSAYDSHRLQFDANDPAYDHLAAGATQLVTVNYNVADGHGGVTPASTQILVHGTNDGPVATDDVNSATEDAPLVTGSVATNDSDVDDGETATLSYALNAPVAGLTLNANGSYSFNPANAAYQHLAAGETTQVVANYTVTDVHNATDTGTLTITVTGINDAPVVGGLSANTALFIEEGGPVLLDAPPTAATVTDVDSPDFGGGSLTVAITANGVAAEDQLSIAFAGLLGGGSGIVTYNGIQFATYTGGGAGGSGLVFSFDSDASPAAVQALVRAIQYDNSNTLNPSTLSRTVTWTLVDGDGTANGGADTRTITSFIAVSGVNDAPSGTDATLTLTEDGSRTLAAADFGFSDGDGNSFAGIFISALPTHGTLYFDPDGAGSSPPSPVALNQLILKSQIDNGQLVYVPAPDGNGTGYDSFGFQVFDSGGTSNGGQDTDQSPNTITFDVTAVNDPPVNNVPGAQSTNEDSARIFSTANGNAISVSDVDVGAGNLTVTLTVAHGTLTLAGVTGLSFDAGANGTATMTISGTAAAINAALDGMTYAPAGNYNGPDSLQIQTSDNGNSGTGGTLTDSDTVAITVVSINDAPAGTDKTVTIAEDGSYTFAVADFGFSDANDSPANAFLAVTFTTVPANGTLLYDADGAGIDPPVAVTAGQSILASEIALGKLVFVPNPDANGSPLSSFTFQVQDDGDTANGGVDLDPIANTFRLNVTAVNDAPVNNVPGGQNVNEDGNLTFTSGNGNPISVSDVDSASGNITVTLTVLHGTLTIGGNVGLTSLNGDGTATVSFTGTVNAVNNSLNGLVYMPAADYNGPDQLQITTSDGGHTGTGGTLIDTDSVSINVVSINDAPAGADNAVTINEDSTYVFATGDFGFTDPNDSPANSLLAVTFTTLPTNGTLLYDADGAGVNPPVAVTLGESILASEIALGKLSFVPTADANGTPLSSFTFQVQDDGGTTDGGVDLDPIANTFTINVNAVNDAPVNNVPAAQSVDEDGSLVLSNAFGNAIQVFDVDAGSGNVSVTLSVAHGILTVDVVGGLSYLDNGTSSVTISGTVAAINSALGNALTYDPDANYHGPDAISVQTTDNGNSGAGPAGTDSDSIAITVNSVNDAPLGADNTVVGSEDDPYAFTAADFGFSDPVEGNAFAGVVITSLPAAGTLFLDQDGAGVNPPVAVVAGQLISIADINAGHLYFQPVMDAYGTNYASFTFQVQDDGGVSNGGVDTDTTPRTMTINVTQDNLPPVVDLDSGTGGIDYTTTFTEDGAAVGIGSGISVTDPDSGIGDMIESAVITLTDAVAGDTLVILGGLPAGINAMTSVLAGQIKITLTGTASQADYQSVLDQIRYGSTSQNPDVYGTDTSRTVTVTVNDGVVDSAVATATIHITAIDDAPVAQPDAFTITESGTIVGGNLFADNGAGADTDPDDPALTIAAVNGSAANVNTQITLASGALLTVHDDGTFDYDPNGAFLTTPTAGSGASNTPSHDSFSYTLDGGNIVTVTITLTGLDTDDLLRGTAGVDMLSAGSGNDSLDGLAGADLMLGGTGNDTYFVDNVGDRAVEAMGEGTDLVLASVSYQLESGTEIEILSTAANGGTAAINLVGNEFDQVIYGNAGANYLDGGTGTDTLVGFGGDDSYAVDDSTDFVAEAAGGGTDIVYVRDSFFLASGQEVEYLAAISQVGTAPIFIVGNEFGQVIYGNAGDNYLDGGSGTDTLVGFGGDDSYVVDDSTDFVAEAAGGGTDIVYVRDSFSLAAGQEVEYLAAISQIGTAPIFIVGNELNQVIYGNAGANYLDGGSGTDTLVGLGGNDSYVVDDSTDFVAEGVGGGDDIVYVRASFSLAAGQEVETLSAASLADTAPIVIVGNEFCQVIYGNAGNNYLDGGSGTDTLVGLGGDDSYVVDDSTDFVAEAAGGGTDIVYVRDSFSLASGQEVEYLLAISQADTAPIFIVGNELDQIVYGNAGNNYLDGGSGTDTLIGLGGDDTYVVDSLGDIVVEAAGEGSDVVYARSSFTLGAGQAIEVLSAVSNAATTAMDLTGNELANIIYGNNGANVLNGGAGADYLLGVGGADSFAFTTALGGGNVDTIGDFQTGVDRILLDHAIFDQLVAGALGSTLFHVGAQATDEDQRIIYDDATGNLYYDADGVGSSAQVLFATLAGSPPLAASDFAVI